MQLVAKLGYRNASFRLLFRGQLADYPANRPDTEVSQLFPSLWRHGPRGREKALKHLDKWTAKLRTLPILSRRDKRHLRTMPERAWAVLQHYSSVTRCQTPLLDVTESVRVAASFATYDYDQDTPNPNPYGYLFVFGFPALQQATTISVDDGLIMLRLQSVCPDKARRPHLQRGFLVGTYPTNRFGGKAHKNFAHRLVAKLRLPTRSTFWNVDRPLDKIAVYPMTDEFRDALAK